MELTPERDVPERTTEGIQELIQEQLARIGRDKVRADIEALLVTPEMHMRNWDYGEKGQQLPCWTVARDTQQGIDYLYSDFGFGPEHPWGHASPEDPWFGMDSKWHGSLANARRDSLRAGTLFSPFAAVTDRTIRPSGAANAAIFILGMTFVAPVPLIPLLHCIGAAIGEVELSPEFGLPVSGAMMAGWWAVMSVLLFITRAIVDRDHPIGWKAKWAAKTMAKIAVVLFLVICAAWLFAWYTGARRRWKSAALQEIHQLASDKQWVTKELSILAGKEKDEGKRVIAEGWLTDRMILMKSGEWLVYRSHCPKRPPHDVKDIFLAKGSNGVWYYSTCHFCVDMCALVMMQHGEQPLDLRAFAEGYHLAEFDGESDECLRETKTAPDWEALDRAYESAKKLEKIKSTEAAKTSR